MTDLAQLTLQEGQSLLRRRAVSSVELTQAVLDRILALDNDVKAFLTLAPQVALEQAAEADERRAAGEEGLLLGVPLAIKDVICVEGLPTTCGSRILEDYVPPFSATVV
jgi:aspartyl-tRNA(Asn)/glutamyl-tRNA(Gln) amidotransferase subunit A